MNTSQRPPCLICWASGKDCYYITGFPSCISCTAFGQECTPSGPLQPLAPTANSVNGPTPFQPLSVPLPPTTAVPSVSNPLTPAPLITTFPPLSVQAGAPTISPTFAASSSSSSTSPPDTTAHSSGSSHSPPTRSSPPPAKKRRPSVSTSSGTLTQQSPNQAPRQRQKPARSPTTRSKTSSVSSLPSPTKYASLATAEGIRALAVELFEESFRTRPRTWGFAQHLVYDIRTEFERVGGSLERLGPVGKALVMIRMAYGSISTMHPAVIRIAPSSNHTMLLQGDLSSYGRQRAATELAISSQAVNLVQGLGAFEIATYRNMGLLGELAMLFARTDIRKAKSFTQTAIEHWRKLQAANPGVALCPSETGICFSIACLDATVTFHGAAKGQCDMPQLSDNDISSLVHPSGIPVPAFVRPDYCVDLLEAWQDRPLTSIDEVLWAANTACYRMLSILSSSDTDGNMPRVPPATYQKVLSTMRKQKPCMTQLRRKWGLISDAEDGDDVLAPFTLHENVANREYIFRLLAILHPRLSESSHLLPLYEEVSRLVWADLTELAVAVEELLDHPRRASSLWGSFMQQFFRCIELLPGGPAYLGVFLRDGEGTLESRRFAAESIAQMLRSVTFYGDQYLAGVEAAERALLEFDRDAAKTFPISYRDDGTPVAGSTA